MAEHFRKYKTQTIGNYSTEKTISENRQAQNLLNLREEKYTCKTVFKHVSPIFFLRKT